MIPCILKRSGTAVPTLITGAVILFFSVPGSAKMSPLPPGQSRLQQTGADRRSPLFVNDFESRLRPYFERRITGPSPGRQPAAAVNPTEADILMIIALWKTLSPEFRTLYKTATRIPDTFDTHTSPGGHFEIYYLPFSRDPVSGVAAVDTIGYGAAGDWRPRLPGASGVPDYIDETAWALDSSWAMEVDRFGFIAPIPRNDSVHTSNRYPVVITSLAQNYYGMTYPDTAPAGPRGYPSHFELRNEWNGAPWTGLGYEAKPENGIRVTCVHEFFHGIQYAMTWNVVAMDRLDDFPLGWIEGTAVLMEELGFDYINDYLQYSTAFFGDPGMQFFGYSNIYSNSLLTKYLYEKNGGIGLLRSVLYANYSAPLPFDRNLRTASLLSGPAWSLLLGRFHTASYFTGPRADTSLFVADAGLMGRWTWQHDVPTGSSITKTVRPYGMRMFSFAPGSADGDKASLILHCDAASIDTIPHPSWAASCIIRPKTGSDTVLPLTIDNTGAAVVHIPGWKSLDDIVLLVTNGAPSESRSATVTFMPDSGRASLVIFPNPGHIRAQRFIRFEGRDIAGIRIYSVDGALVAVSADRSFQRYGNGLMWLLVNSSGAAVVPGSYTAVVTRDGAPDGGKRYSRHTLLVFP